MFLVALMVEVENNDIRFPTVHTRMGFQIFKNKSPIFIPLSFIIPLQPFQKCFPVSSLRANDRLAMTIPAIVLKAIFFPLISIEIALRLNRAALSTKL
jgi:hypothetical protein